MKWTNKIAKLALITLFLAQSSHAFAMMGKMEMFKGVLARTADEPVARRDALNQITQIFSGTHAGVSGSKEQISENTIKKLHKASMDVVRDQKSTLFQAIAHEKAIDTAFAKLVNPSEPTIRIHSEASSALKAKIGNGLTEDYARNGSVGQRHNTEFIQAQIRSSSLTRDPGLPSLPGFAPPIPPNLK